MLTLFILKNYKNQALTNVTPTVCHEDPLSFLTASSLLLGTPLGLISLNDR